MQEKEKTLTEIAKEVAIRVWQPRHSLFDLKSIVYSDYYSKDDNSENYIIWLDHCRDFINGIIKELRFDFNKESAVEAVYASKSSGSLEIEVNIIPKDVRLIRVCFPFSLIVNGVIDREELTDNLTALVNIVDAFKKTPSGERIEKSLNYDD